MPGTLPTQPALLLVAAALVVAAALLLRTHGGEPIGTGHRRRPRRRGQNVVDSAQGMFGSLRVLSLVWEDGEPVRVLANDTSFQSATYVAEASWYVPVFEYYYLYDLMFELGLPVRRVLMLGGGGYSYPKWLLVNHPHIHVDVVEIDPAVTRLARDHFYLDRLEGLFGEGGTRESGALGLVQGDGRAYLEHADTRYDAILNDTFSGEEPTPTLASLQAARLAHGLLAPGGAYLANVIGSLEGRRAHYPRSVVRTLRQVFAHVYIVPCGRRDPAELGNNMVVATDSGAPFPAGFELTTTQADQILLDPTARTGLDS